MHLNLPRQARVKREMQLARDNLHDIEFTRMSHLMSGQVKGTLTSFCSSQVNLGLNFVVLELPDNSFRAAYANLGFWNRLRTDLQLRGYVLKHNRRPNRDFCGLFITGNHEPHAGGEQQREYLEPEVVDHVPFEESDHGCDSVSDFRWGADSISGESTGLSKSSSIGCEIGVGRVTGGLWRRTSLSSRSRNCYTVRSRSILPPTAMLIAPVSSEQITAIASVSSVIPIPARWRVPSCVDNRGFIESGRKQAAAAIRSFCTITAPS